MKLSCTILAVFMAVAAVGLTEAQTQPAQGPAPQPQPQHEWMPQGIDALRQSASSKTEFTLDHSMLAFASKLDPDNDDLRRVIAGVNAVSVRNFRYSGRSGYDPESLGSVKEEYRTAGWKQLMNNHAKDGGSGVTDLWVRMENNAVSNVAVLQAKASEVTFVLVSGSISPLDLFRLGGHFGIPKMDGGVVIPNTHP